MQVFEFDPSSLPVQRLIVVASMVVLLTWVANRLQQLVNLARAFLRRWRCWASLPGRVKQLEIYHVHRNRTGEDRTARLGNLTECRTPNLPAKSRAAIGDYPWLAGHSFEEGVAQQSDGHRVNEARGTADLQASSTVAVADDALEQDEADRRWTPPTEVMRRAAFESERLDRASEDLSA